MKEREGGEGFRLQIGGQKRGKGGEEKEKRKDERKKGSKGGEGVSGATLFHSFVRRRASFRTN